MKDSMNEFGVGGAGRVGFQLGSGVRFGGNEAQTIPPKEITHFKTSSRANSQIPRPFNKI